MYFESFPIGSLTCNGWLCKTRFRNGAHGRRGVKSMNYDTSESCCSPYTRMFRDPTYFRSGFAMCGQSHQRPSGPPSIDNIYPWGASAAAGGGLGGGCVGSRRPRGWVRHRAFSGPSRRPPGAKLETRSGRRTCVRADSRDGCLRCLRHELVVEKAARVLTLTSKYRIGSHRPTCAVWLV